MQKSMEPPSPEGGINLQYFEVPEDKVLLAYEVLGHTDKLNDLSVPLIVFTPGGQTGRNSARRVAQAVLGSFGDEPCVAVIWDRRNMGLSTFKYAGNALIAVDLK